MTARPLISRPYVEHPVFFKAREVPRETDLLQVFIHPSSAMFAKIVLRRYVALRETINGSPKYVA